MVTPRALHADTNPAVPAAANPRSGRQWCYELSLSIPTNLVLCVATRALRKAS